MTGYSNNMAFFAESGEQPLIMESIVQYPSHFAAIIYQLALLGDLSKSTLLDNLHILENSLVTHCRMNYSDISDTLNLLRKDGWLEKTDNRWRLKPSHENAVFLWLLTHRDILCTVQQEIGNSRMRGVLRPERLRMWLAILGGDTSNLSEYLSKLASDYDYVTSEHPTASLLANGVGKQAFSLLDSDVQALLLATFLSDASSRLSECADIWQFACNYADAMHSIPSILLGPLALHALWRDDQVRLEKLTSEGDLPLVVMGWIALYRGDHEGAMDAYRQIVSQYRKATRKRKLHLPQLSAMMTALTLLNQDESVHATTLIELTRYAIDEGFGIGWSLLQGLILECNGTLTLSTPWNTEVPFTGIAGVMQALVLFWRSDALDRDCLHQCLVAFSTLLFTRGYCLLAYEIRTILHLQFDEPAPSPVVNRFPLCLLWQRKDAWEYALDALGQLTSQNNDNTSRLAWLLNLASCNLELTPLEQKRNKHGWSKGRPVALKRLYESADAMPWLLAQDRQVVRHINYSFAYSFYDYNGSYALDGEAALFALAGHPAVFWHDAPDVRIDIEPGQVTLIISEEEDKLSLRLAPPINDSQYLFTEKETPTRLVVYQISDEHRRIAAIIRKGLCVPIAARERVLQSVLAIAPLLPVQANLPELMAHIHHVPPNETIYAHLLPLGEGLRLQLLVRPLANGVWLPPGRGNEILNGNKDGQSVQTWRDLQKERKNMQEALYACPQLVSTDPDNTEWQFFDTQDALEALTQLRAVDTKLLECVWPEGERLRLCGRSDMHALKLNVRRQGEWFAMSGELALDDGRVLQLRQVLALLQESRGNFIRMGEQEWLALDGQLRQRLQQIALLAGVSDGIGVTLNALTLPFLKTLAEEAGQFDGDNQWHQQFHGLEMCEMHQPVLPSTLKANLRDYQQEGFCWLSRLAHWGVGACLADDMGLGKTLQVLALLLERAAVGPQLVVVPTSLTYNWISESERYAPTLRICDYQRWRKVSTAGEFDVVVVSYGLLLQDADTFASQQWHSVVLDEAQAIKNAQTKRARAVMALKADFRVALSGTPVENHLGELWSLFRFLNPGLLGGLKSFNQRFVTPIENGDRLAGNTLKQLIKPFILRRTKAQVLDELPSRTDILHLIPMSEDERHWYEALRQQAVERLEQGGDNISPLQVLTEITRLRRFCCHPSLAIDNIHAKSSKLSACLSIIDELRENHHKALIFSQFVDHLMLLCTVLNERNIIYQYLDGSTSPVKRKKRVDAFQSGEGDFFLISLKAGGTGLNLTAADYVIHLDPWWNPAVEDQASDRAHRIGQTRPVTVYRLVMEDTIEQKIVTLHSRKRQVAADLLEGSDTIGRLGSEDLLSVLRGE